MNDKNENEYILECADIMEKAAESMRKVSGLLKGEDTRKRYYSFADHCDEVSENLRCYERELSLNGVEEDSEAELFLNKFRHYKDNKVLVMTMTTAYENWHSLAESEKNEEASQRLMYNANCCKAMAAGIMKDCRIVENTLMSMNAEMRMIIQKFIDEGYRSKCQKAIDILMSIYRK